MRLAEVELKTAFGAARLGGDMEVMSNENGKDMRRRDRRFPFGTPDWDAVDREAKWELAGCIILLIVTVSMAAAVNLYAP